MAWEYTQLSTSWSSRLRAGAPVLLDGALGTELERRNVPAGLPLWSTHALLEAPETIANIHRDYVAAGAEVLTAASFRTQRRSLARAPGARLESQAGPLTRQAVLLARRAAQQASRPCWVAGSAPPPEDCYRPDQVPDERVARSEHREHIAHLVEAGCDLIAVETMNCVREARVAAEAAAETGVPFWVSFVCGADAHLLSGETLAAAIDAIRESRPAAVGVNCVAISEVSACLPVLANCGLDFLVYANLGAPSEDGSRTDWREPEVFAAEASAWVQAGAAGVGGCCGTEPEHIRAVATALESSSHSDG